MKQVRRSDFCNFKSTNGMYPHKIRSGVFLQYYDKDSAAFIVVCTITYNRLLYSERVQVIE